MNDTRHSEIPDNFFYDIVEALPYEIFICDANGKILYLNPASQFLTGRLKENVLGHNIKELVKDGTISDSVTLKIMEKKKPCKIIQKVNNGNDLLIFGIPIFDRNGDLEYVVSTAQDINELSSINNSLLEENQNLQQELKVLSRIKEDYLSLQDTMYVGEAYQHIINKLIRVSKLDIIILIQGETGTGKTGIAKMIHQLSEYQDGPFIKINCGTIPENLFESELFGYEEGSFTGASKGGKIGKIELANNGTLFLDEIGELPLSMQVKFLDFIQEKTIVRVGGHKKIKVNTRIIAATHRDIKAMSEEGSFRQDLYYRLNVFPIEIPPLRQWESDIMSLAQFFLYQYNKKYHRKKYFSKDIAAPIMQYDWPGNIREMEHLMERLFIQEEGNELTGKAFRLIIEKQENPEEMIHCSDIVPLKAAKAEIEKQLIQKAYNIYNSSYEVAKALHIDQSTVIKLKKKHNL